MIDPLMLIGIPFWVVSLLLGAFKVNKVWFVLLFPLTFVVAEIVFHTIEAQLIVGIGLQRELKIFAASVIAMLSMSVPYAIARL